MFNCSLETHIQQNLLTMFAGTPHIRNILPSLSNSEFVMSQKILISHAQPSTAVCFLEKKTKQTQSNKDTPVFSEERSRSAFSCETSYQVLFPGHLAVEKFS